ncbi:sulfatase [Halorientalis halophila]|uniref:sulfatase family protein n=1 Tax=Halorientalis halophila TaxID=3108499 RepID=UPI003008D22E
MNVVVVVVDALRASDVGCYGRDADITPNVDALAEESMVFEHCFAASNKTDVSMSSLMSGKYPREHGITHHGTRHNEGNLQRLEERSPKFLPELLQDAGYETIGVDWMGRWHEWGYDDYGVESGGRNVQDTGDTLAEKAFNHAKDAVLELPDPLLTPIMKQYYRRMGYDDFRVDCEGLTDIAIDRIDDADDPFFTLLHYWDVHPPYLPPEEHQEQFEYDGEDEHLSKYFGDGAKGPLSAAFQAYARGEQTHMSDAKEAYDGAISWVDEQLGRLLDYLREEGLKEETLVVVTADHGHNFGEHDIFSDNVGLYDTSIQVPLIVSHPEHDPHRIDGIVQLTDVAPTIMDYAGVPIPDDVRGNVLPETREYAFAESIEHRMQMIRTDRWKLIVPRDVDYLQSRRWYDGDGTPELYDLEADPGETTNVAAENPEVRERLEGMLTDELDRQEENARSGSSRDVDIEDDDMDDIKSRLNALGYADDGNV